MNDWHLLWRGFRGGYGRLGNYWRCWHLQVWTASGRRHYGFGPVVLSRAEVSQEGKER